MAGSSAQKQKEYSFEELDVAAKRTKNGVPYFIFSTNAGKYELSLTDLDMKTEFYELVFAKDYADAEKKFHSKREKLYDTLLKDSPQFISTLESLIKKRCGVSLTDEQVKKLFSAMVDQEIALAKTVRNELSKKVFSEAGGVDVAKIVPKKGYRSGEITIDTSDAERYPEKVFAESYATISDPQVVAAIANSLKLGTGKTDAKEILINYINEKYGNSFKTTDKIADYFLEDFIKAYAIPATIGGKGWKSGEKVEAFQILYNSEFVDKVEEGSVIAVDGIYGSRQTKVAIEKTQAYLLENGHYDGYLKARYGKAWEQMTDAEKAKVRDKVVDGILGEETLKALRSYFSAPAQKDVLGMLEKSDDQVDDIIIKIRDEGDLASLDRLVAGIDSQLEQKLLSKADLARLKVLREKLLQVRDETQANSQKGSKPTSEEM